MKVQKIKSMPVRCTIPKITSKQHRALQAGKEVDVDAEAGTYLIKFGYVKPIVGGKDKT